MKKLLLIVLSSLIFLNSMVLPLTVSAATGDPTSAGTWYDQDFKTWYTKVADPTNPSEIFGERYTSAQVEWVIYGIFAFFINHIAPPGSAQACMGGDSVACITSIKKFTDSLNNLKTGQINNNDQSLSSLVFEDRPISGISYTRNLIKKFNLVPVANAQTTGFGFDALKPIQNMWKGVRDVSYGLFVIVAVVFAFMIMFRVKINPQTVISVQSSIPKVIGALIAVTFSYAIAGFLVDLMYIVIGIVSLMASKMFYFGTSGINIHGGAPMYFNFLTLGQPFGGSFQLGVLGLMAFYAGIFITPLIFVLFSISLATEIPAFAFVALGICVLVALLIVWHMLKTFWALLKAFVNIILLTVFAPLQLSLGALVPSFGFGQWVKSYISNLSVFVVTGVLLLFTFYFLGQGIGLIFSATPLGAIIDVLTTGTTTAFDFSKASWPPLLGASGPLWAGLMMLAVSFVMFTLIPKATEIIQGVLSGKPFAYGTAIGEAFGPLNMGARYYAGSAAESLSARGGYHAPWPFRNTKLDKVTQGNPDVSAGISALLEAWQRSK